MAVTVNVLSEARTLSTTSGRTLYVLDGMLGEDLDALIAACYSKSCAPPPVGTGGSDKGGRPPATTDVQTFLERTDAFNLKGASSALVMKEFELAFLVDGVVKTETLSYETDEVLNRIVKQLGIDGPPTVLSTEEFDAHLAEGGWTEVHRGFGNGAAVTAFVEGKYSVGVGVRGSGWYASSDSGDAAMYARPTWTTLQVVGNRVVRMAISPNARIIDFDLPSSRQDRGEPDLKSFDQSLRSMGGLLKTSDLQDHPNLRKITRDDGRMAAVLGYDVIRVNRGIHTHYVILNREAVIVDGGTLS